MLCEKCKHELNDKTLICPKCSSLNLNANVINVETARKLICLKKFDTARLLLEIMAKLNNSDAMLLLCDLYIENRINCINDINCIISEYLERASYLGNEYAKRRIIEACFYEKFNYKFDIVKIESLIEDLCESRMKKVYLNILNNIKARKDDDYNKRTSRLLDALFE